MARSVQAEGKTCPKFHSVQDVGDLGAFEEVCSCNWRPGLVHRPGDIARPDLWPSSHQLWGTTSLAGWSDAPPSPDRPTPLASTDRAAHSSILRKSAPHTNNHNGKSARSSQQTLAKLSSKSAGNTREARDDVGFEHRLEASEYIKEYREKHVIRLIGSDGCPVEDGNLAFGKTLPDPYTFRSETFRKMYGRLQDFLERRPKRTLAAGAPFTVQAHRLPAPPLETAPTDMKARRAFSFSDEVQANLSNVFSPVFLRPKDLAFRPFICGSRAGNTQGLAKLRHSHSAERTGGSLPNIARDADMGSTKQAYRLSAAPKPGLASQTDLHTLKPKSANGSQTKIKANRAGSEPNIMSAEFDSAMTQFLQNAKQNLDRVREQRIRKEAMDKGRLVNRRGKRSDLVGTPGQHGTMRSDTAVTDGHVRRIKLGVS